MAATTHATQPAATAAPEPTEPEVFTGISFEQMLEDYDYFWDMVENKINFPTKVWASHGFDYAAWRDENRARITPEMEQWQFAILMLQCRNTIYPVAHFNYLPKEQLNEYLDMVAFWYGTNNIAKARDSGFYTDGFYEMWMSQIGPLRYPTDKVFESADFGELTEICAGANGGKLENEKIAVLELTTFREDFAGNLDKLQVFYDSIKDYDHLIIDIRDNGGGYVNQWEYAIVAPLAHKNTRHTWYMTVDSGENTWEYNRKGMWQGPSRVPAEQWLLEHPEAKSFIDAYYSDDAGVYSVSLGINGTMTADKTEGFGGKIWLLVNENTYSAADTFTDYCIRSGFAAVVGTRSGGNGLSNGSNIVPCCFMLPNSRFVFRYYTGIGINFDGTSNIEHGTMPDIYTEQDALEHTLAFIRSGEYDN